MTATNTNDEILVHIGGLISDPTTQVPIVILRASEEELILPIWIGLQEAQAIARRLEGEAEPLRPMTHDLLLASWKTFGAEVQRVVITQLEEGTFYAEVVLLQSESELTLDARPSDALAVALRAACPIFVRRQVFQAAQQSSAAEETEEERIRRMLEELSAEDLGDYTM